jgi:hypothetical protein
MHILLLALAILGATGCATFAPDLHGIYVTDDVATVERIDGIPAAVLIGDPGIPRGESSRQLAESVARRVADSPDAPVILLGDVFYEWGLIGACQGTEPPVSRPFCRHAGTPEAQIEAVLGPFRDALSVNPVVALAGNHEYYGGTASLENACRLVPEMASGWRFFADGCGLDDRHPVETLDLGSVAILLIDSESLLRDTSGREQALYGLRQTLRYYRTQEPDVWRVLAAHHPLETYGSHNGATLGNGLQKDLYAIRGTLLWPLFYPIERLIGPQNVFDWGYRGMRRDLYALLREEPVDVMVAGHDHSLQHVRIHDGGLTHQLVSGAGSKRTGVQRLGLDLLWTNRLARLVGLGDLLPSPELDLAFALGRPAGGELTGYGYAVLVPTAAGLGIEFYDAASDVPLYATILGRPPSPPSPFPFHGPGEALRVGEPVRPE